MGNYLPPGQHYLRLAKKPVSAAAVYFDAEGKVLLVKPNYRDTWQLPGGSTEKVESPYDACLREVKEELGAKFPVKNLLLIEYFKLDPERELIHLVFNGGTLDSQAISKIVIQKEELDDYGFYALDTALNMVSPLAKARVESIKKAMETNKVVYLENGEEIK